MKQYQSNRMRGFRRGVASFYIVAFSTLILMVVSTGFSTVILSEVTRTSNDDLSQSAYDAALAGIEDAKLAFSNYRRCKDVGPTEPNSDGVLTCGEIMYYMMNPSCSMVARMLGRLPDDPVSDEETTEAIVKDVINADGSTTNQAYTCVKLSTALEDYRANLNSTTRNRVVSVGFSTKGGDYVSSDKIKAIRLSWYVAREDTVTNYKNFQSNRVTFQPRKQEFAVVPPTIALQMIQTADKFETTDFSIASNSKTRGSNQALADDEIARKTVKKSCVGGNCTDRAMMYFVPTDNADAALESKKSDSYVGIWNGSVRENQLSAEQVTKTNDRYYQNKPFATYCNPDGTSEFLCSVTIELPNPIGDGSRSDDTFLFMVSLPYGEPDTNFAIQYICKDGTVCSEGENLAWIRDAQLTIDSTGRANDLYRRIETRLETSDTSFAYPMYALQLLGQDNLFSMYKRWVVKSEYNF